MLPDTLTMDGIAGAERDQLLRWFENFCGDGGVRINTKDLRRRLRRYLEAALEAATQRPPKTECSNRGTVHQGGCAAQGCEVCKAALEKRGPGRPRKHPPKVPKRLHNETRAVLAQLIAGDVLHHFYGDGRRIEVKVLQPLSAETGKGGRFQVIGSEKEYTNIRKLMVEYSNGTSYNLLNFFGLRPWPKHKKREGNNTPPAAPMLPGIAYDADTLQRVTTI